MVVPRLAWALPEFEILPTGTGTFKTSLKICWAPQEVK